MSDVVREAKKAWPFGLVIRMWFPVPRFATGNEQMIWKDKNTGRRRIAPREEVFQYKKHLAVRCHEEVYGLRRDLEIASLEFPIETHELRLDFMFGFQKEGRGEQRMNATDIDNLRKTTQDAFRGILYTNDRQITEGYTCKGYAPPGLGENDIVWLVISRAGYRAWDKMDQLYRNITPYPPWLSTEQDRVLAEPGHIIIPPPGASMPGSSLLKKG